MSSPGGPIPSGKWTASRDNYGSTLTVLEMYTQALSFLVRGRVIARISLGTQVRFSGSPVAEFVAKRLRAIDVVSVQNFFFIIAYLLMCLI